MFSRLAGYEDTNDAERLCVDPTMRHIVGGRARNSYARMTGTNVESMATKRYRRGKYAVAAEKSLFSTSDFTVSVVRSLWSAAQILDSACPTRRIGYNCGESPAMVAGATPSGKSQFGDCCFSTQPVNQESLS